MHKHTRPARAGLALLLLTFDSVALATTGQDLPVGAPGESRPPKISSAAAGARISRLNEAFLAQLDTLPAERTLAVEAVRLAWRERYAGQQPEQFIPDALAELYPPFAAALRAFDDGRPVEASRAFKQLSMASDRFLASSAAYFHARSLIDAGMLEEAQLYLRSAVSGEPSLLEFTPLASQAWLMLAYVELANLDYEAASQTLVQLGEAFEDAPERVTAAARQMRLEIERRERGTLEEVATVMDYVAGRLRIADARGSVRDRQQQVLDLLDKMIKESEDREQQARNAAARRARSGGREGGRNPAQGAPNKPAEESEARPTAQSGAANLHGAPLATPGEMWGKLPPAERERILQSLKDRFPSRYRQLVEQYYRSLAEDK